MKRTKFFTSRYYKIMKAFYERDNMDLINAVHEIKTLFSLNDSEYYKYYMYYTYWVNS